MLSKLRILLFVVYFFIFPFIVFSQTSGANQQLLGTWVNNVGSSIYSITFNQNGTFSSNIHFSENGNGNYEIIGSKLFLMYSNNRVYVFDYYVLSNGRRLILGLPIWDEQMMFIKQ
jgi:hypothetical protein